MKKEDKKYIIYATLWLILIPFSFWSIILTQQPVLFIGTLIFHFLFCFKNFFYALHNKHKTIAFYIILTIIILPLGLGISFGYYLIQLVCKRYSEKEFEISTINESGV